MSSAEGLPSDLLERSPQEGARRVAMALVDRAAKRSEQLDVGDDPEALHDFRVALRRLRCWLRSFPDELGAGTVAKASVALAELTAGTGDARDAEVQVAWLEEHRAELPRSRQAGVTALIHALEEEMTAAYAALDLRITRRFQSMSKELRGKVGAYRARIDPEGGPADGFAATVARGAADQGEILRGELDAIRDVADADQIHRARIEGKRLRYLLEPFADTSKPVKTAVKRLKELQEILGELNDLRMLEKTSRDFLERDSLARLQAAAHKAETLDEEGLERDLRAGRARESGLLAVIGLIARHRGRLFGELLLQRSGDPSGENTPPELFEALAAAEASLGEGAGVHLEVERKYLLRGMPPEAVDAPSVEIEQGYMPGKRVRERLRRAVGSVDECFTRTVKLGRGLRRAEFEEEIAGELFAQLWPLTAGSRVRKRRHRVEEGGYVWEIDAFLDRELFLAEVEFSAGETQTPLPDWLVPYVVREVTEDAEYTNLALAR